MIMEQKLDINDFYMTEYVCSGCGNICSRKDATCPVCGELRIGKLSPDADKTKYFRSR